MELIPTIQERFFDLYHKMDSNDSSIIRYYAAVTKWEDIYQMKCPYNSFESFKNAMSYHRNKK